VFDDPKDTNDSVESTEEIVTDSVEELSSDDLFAFDDTDETPQESPEAEEHEEDEGEAIEPKELDIHEQRRLEGFRWFIIHANTGHENKVKRNIEMGIKANGLDDSFGDILVAEQEVVEMKNGKRVARKRKLFPSYVLVEMKMNKETQHLINEIPGVSRFIGGNQLKPQAISQEEVNQILGKMTETEESGALLEIPYNVGDQVQVIDGPFSDWSGIINEINQDKGKLTVMVSIFGSETPVELDFLQVKEM
jgi:transcription termination/antitermination protein NusG